MRSFSNPHILVIDTFHLETDISVMALYPQPLTLPHPSDEFLRNARSVLS